MRNRSCFFPVGIFLGLAALSGCRPSAPTPAVPRSPSVPPQPAASAAAPLFQDVAERAGIRFTHSNGATGKFYFIESTPAGCAFLDYDNDGFQDVFLVQSGSSEPPDTVKDRPHCALYHNNGDGTFTDVTAGSGFDTDLGYMQGVTIGDYDNDGYPDLFITGYGGNHLFHNTGPHPPPLPQEQGRGETNRLPPPLFWGRVREGGHPLFEDVTHLMGLDNVKGYATSAAFGDYDNDGKLDLYVCYYTPWTWEQNFSCKASGNPDYCSPDVYNPETHHLYHNEGTRFVDVSEKAGITKAKGRGLGVGFVDYDNDGKQDIFVANDLTPNMLWHNNGNGTFTNVALQLGCAYDSTGVTMAGMGIGIADYDHSGRESLFVGNFSNQPNTLYRNVGGLFRDDSYASGLALPHMKFLTFGCEFFDYDADGWPDLIVANGHVQVTADKQLEGTTYKERKQLFKNNGNGTFREIADTNLLGDLAVPTVGRGLAVGDYDNDGRLDVLANSQNSPAQLLRNLDTGPNHWVSFLTVGVKSNREGRHTRFLLEAGGMKQLGTVRAGSSYLSYSDRRVYFGLGSAAKIDRVEIRWPSGTKETLSGLATDQCYIVTEGKGITGKLPTARKPGIGLSASSDDKSVQK